MLKKIIYSIGANIRNPNLLKKYLFLKDSEKWTLSELEDYQLIKLKELLKLAYNNSTYYKHKLDASKINISTISSLNDLKKIPILTKSDLLKNTAEIHTNTIFKKQFLAATSGTSGQSLKFYRNEEADSFNRASIQRGYSWHNVNPWDKNGYFWGFNFSIKEKIKNTILDTLQNRFRIFTYEDKSFKKFVKKIRKATYIHGYSSMIYQTALLINKNNMPKPKNIKMVKGTSEKIFDYYQKEIEKAFGVKMISEYGSTESGIIAFECKKGSLHINMEGVIVEEMDNEILITNLQLKSFPIIRYKLGDYILLAPKDKKCSCGLNHLLIEEVTGRVGANVYGKTNIYPSLTFYYIFKNLSKNYQINLIYQVIQEKKGFLKFNIKNKLDIQVEVYLKKEIEKYFKNDITYSISDNAILKNKKGKLKDFISYINE